MTSNQVLSVYEQIAGLSDQMVAVARASDFERLATLENQCAAQVLSMDSSVPGLSGAARLRKIALLKQIMANDRAIRDVTEPWMGQLSKVMQAPPRAPG